MSLCLSYWTRIFHSKHSMILHPHTCNPHGLDGWPRSRAANPHVCSRNIHPRYRSPGHSPRGHNLSESFLYHTKFLFLNVQYIVHESLLFLKFIFKGAGLWILKKLSLNNLFLSLSTAYNCMCYSSNGNYDSFKYQARSTNTPLLVTHFS